MIGQGLQLLEVLAINGVRVREGRVVRLGNIDEIKNCRQSRLGTNPSNNALNGIATKNNTY